MEELEAKMHTQLTKVASTLSLQENKTIKMESNSQFGFFFRVNLKVNLTKFWLGLLRFRIDKLNVLSSGW